MAAHHQVYMSTMRLAQTPSYNYYILLFCDSFDVLVRDCGTISEKLTSCSWLIHRCWRRFSLGSVTRAQCERVFNCADYKHAYLLTDLVVWLLLTEVGSVVPSSWGRAPVWSAEPVFREGWLHFAIATRGHQPPSLHSSHRSRPVSDMSTECDIFCQSVGWSWNDQYHTTAHLDTR